jgi:AcrR family transcriptional regulator
MIRRKRQPVGTRSTGSGAAKPPKSARSAKPTKSAKEPKALRWERRPGERPHEILEAALRVFAERGYRNTRLDEVAAAAGVTKGAVYHYFANKEDLLLRAIEHYQARAFGRLEDALRGAEGPPSTRIRVAFRALFGGQDPARRDILVLLHRVVPEVPAIYREWIVSGPMKAWKIVAGLIDAGVESGEFRSDADAEGSARVVLTGLMLQLNWQRLGADVPDMAVDQDRLIDSAVDLLLAGLRPQAISEPTHPAGD